MIKCNEELRKNLHDAKTFWKKEDQCLVFEAALMKMVIGQLLPDVHEASKAAGFDPRYPDPFTGPRLGFAVRSIWPFITGERVCFWHSVFVFVVFTVAC